MIWLPYNVSSTVYFPLVGSGTAAFSTAGSGSLTGTNVQISKDGGAFSTSTNTGTHVGLGVYSLVLTTSELQAKQVMVIVAGSGGSLGTTVEAQAILIHTYGSGSAQHPFDFGTALSAQTVGTVTRVAGSGATDIWGAGTRTLTGGTYDSNLVNLKGTAAEGTQGTLIVNLVANQSTATLGTVNRLAGSAAADVWAAATRELSGGTYNANIVNLKGTAIAGTQGTANVNVTAIGGDATAATIAGTAFLSLVRGLATGSPLSTTQMKTDLAETSDKHYNGRVVIFLGGTLDGQASDIKDYAGATKVITYSTLTEAPADSQRFLVV